MTKPAEKTNAMRLLDARKIAYRVTVYDASGAFHDAVEAAALIGAPVETVYKTLVVLRDPSTSLRAGPSASLGAGSPGRTRPILVMIPAHLEVDLKRLAKELGEKKLRMATQREAEQLTGLQVGGIAALALLNRGFAMCLDASAQELEKIHVSAGMRGTDIELSVSDLTSVTRAKVVSATG
ncbi:MAG TPA: YbaK/EbsC family protein [Anaerolineae bacterium]|nr:YbaK/EbsC family protein [Anaerolineae bacterium]